MDVREKIRCPYCNHELNKEPNRIIGCPYCKQPVHYRYDELCTEDEAIKYDWREHGRVIFNIVRRYQ